MWKLQADLRKVIRQRQLELWKNISKHLRKFSHHIDRMYPLQLYFISEEAAFYQDRIVEKYEIQTRNKISEELVRMKKPDRGVLY